MLEVRGRKIRQPGVYYALPDFMVLLLSYHQLRLCTRKLEVVVNLSHIFIDAMDAPVIFGSSNDIFGPVVFVWVFGTSSGHWFLRAIFGFWVLGSLARSESGLLMTLLMDT